MFDYFDPHRSKFCFCFFENFKTRARFNKSRMFCSTQNKIRTKQGKRKSELRKNEHHKYDKEHIRLKEFLFSEFFPKKRGQTKLFLMCVCRMCMLSDLNFAIFDEDDEEEYSFVDDEDGLIFICKLTRISNGNRVCVCV